MGLRELTIKNFALIEYIDVEFAPGLNVITGETGAGKTLILKAIEFALGARADARYIRDKERGSVTLLIDIPGPYVESLGLREGEELIVKREIEPGGRTKMYINGEPVPQMKTKEVLFNIFEFHGQFSNIALFTKSYMTNLYDNFLGDKVSKIKKELKENLSRLKVLKEKLRENTSENHEEEIKYIEEQLREFEALGITQDTEDTLRDEEKLLRNAREIVKSVTFSYDLLYGNDTSVGSLLALVKRELGRISSYSSDINNIIDRIDSLSIEVDDISQELYDFREKIEIDDERLEKVEELLSQIYSFKRKYRIKDMTDIISYMNDLKERLKSLYDKKKEIKEIEEEIDNIKFKLKSLADRLTTFRLEKIKDIEKKIEENIKELGMPYAKFTISMVPSKRGEEILTDKGVIYINENGKEEIEFLFSANPDKSPDSLSKVASGGELSRVMLAIKSVLFRRDSMEKVLLFDEIDQGIGERLGDVVGEKLKELSRFNQLIVVTHLSQIAKKADNHIFISKSFLDGKTNVFARLIQGEERNKELLRMIGGEGHIRTLRRE